MGGNAARRTHQTAREAGFHPKDMQLVKTTQVAGVGGGTQAAHWLTEIPVAMEDLMTGQPIVYLYQAKVVEGLEADEIPPLLGRETLSNLNAQLDMQSRLLIIPGRQDAPLVPVPGRLPHEPAVLVRQGSIVIPMELTFSGHLVVRADVYRPPYVPNIRPLLGQPGSRPLRTMGHVFCGNAAPPYGRMWRHEDGDIRVNRWMAEQVTAVPPDAPQRLAYKPRDMTAKDYYSLVKMLVDAGKHHTNTIVPLVWSSAVMDGQTSTSMATVERIVITVPGFGITPDEERPPSTPEAPWPILIPIGQDPSEEDDGNYLVPDFGHDDDEFPRIDQENEEADELEDEYLYESDDEMRIAIQQSRQESLEARQQATDELDTQTAPEDTHESRERHPSVAAQGSSSSGAASAPARSSPDQARSSSADPHWWNQSGNPRRDRCRYAAGARTGRIVLGASLDPRRAHALWQQDCDAPPQGRGRRRRTDSPPPMPHTERTPPVDEAEADDVSITLPPADEEFVVDVLNSFVDSVVGAPRPPPGLPPAVRQPIPPPPPPVPKSLAPSHTAPGYEAAMARQRQAQLARQAEVIDAAPPTPKQLAGRTPPPPSSPDSRH
jgi:hypothetical protein